MTKKKEHTKPVIKAETLTAIPNNMWSSPLRKGVFKLYPGGSVVVDGHNVRNDTKQLIKLKAGEAIPEELTIEKLK